MWNKLVNKLLWQQREHNYNLAKMQYTSSLSNHEYLWHSFNGDFKSRDFTCRVLNIGKSSVQWTWKVCFFPRLSDGLSITSFTGSYLIKLYSIEEMYWITTQFKVYATASLK